MSCNEEEAQRKALELVESGRDPDILVLLFMSFYDYVTLMDIRYALGGGKRFTSSTRALSAINALKQAGLVDELVFRTARRVVRLYRLNECGKRVAEKLKYLIESPPE
ncbi:hypothetical protein MA03_07200 [Infirmifilum uzonense]|uniref:Transcriptional regulator n=1 Tax=Infirmifilum uzonense TaxID=1550241 RepID=A0A0F7CLA4_9CREN|nr:hypothetical protein [Infirmifilum uzonense]AKG39066.1 hypothetical protein MA03_07200 [Infirmifilum uzonense]